MNGSFTFISYGTCLLHVEEDCMLKYTTGTLQIIYRQLAQLLLTDKISMYKFILGNDNISSANIILGKLLEKVGERRTSSNARVQLVLKTGTYKLV